VSTNNYLECFIPMGVKTYLFNILPIVSFNLSSIAICAIDVPPPE
jgi:hypothetical protein